MNESHAMEDAVEDLNKENLAAKAADTVDAHTPVEPEMPQDVINPASQNIDRLEALEKQVHSLANTLDTLVQSAALLVAADKSPVKRPWLYRGGKHHDDD